MRTTLNLPSRLLKDAQRASKAHTKTETIILGLNALLRERQRSALLDLHGKMSLDLDLRKSRARS